MLKIGCFCRFFQQSFVCLNRHFNRRKRKGLNFISKLYPKLDKQMFMIIYKTSCGWMFEINTTYTIIFVVSTKKYVCEIWFVIESLLYFTAKPRIRLIGLFVGWSPDSKSQFGMFGNFGEYRRFEGIVNHWFDAAGENKFIIYGRNLTNWLIKYTAEIGSILGNYMLLGFCINNVIITLVSWLFSRLVVVELSCSTSDRAVSPKITFSEVKTPSLTNSNIKHASL